MYKKVLVTLLTVFFGISINAQNCCSALDDSFASACLENVTPCTPGVAPCDDATFDATFYPANWSFFGCGNCIPANCPAGYDTHGGSSPVKLENFYAELRKEGIHLIWSTALEINNKGFYIEHSRDGTNWKDLDFLDGKGNSNAKNNYSYELSSPWKGANYFRLRQEDFDGKFEYSNIKVVIWQGGIEDLDLVVVPNPAQDFLVPILPTEYKTLESVNYYISSTTGAVVKTFPNQSLFNTKLDISELPMGSYILTSHTGILKHTILFIKN